MALRAGYKQTEVGVIPVDWEVRPLLSTVQIATGQVDPKNEPFRSMVLVAPDHIESKTGRLLEKKTASEQHAISGKYFFRAGDIVYSKIRPYLRKAVLAEFDGLCSADMYPLTPMQYISPYFIFSVLLAHRFSVFAETVSIRSGIPKINRDELSEFNVALPPFVEQEAIAAALSDADALIAALEGLIAKKRQIKQGAMQELLSVESGEWEALPLGEKVTITKGQLITEKDVTPGIVPVIAGGKEPAYYHNKPNRQKNTITISASGANAGYVAFHTEPIFASDCSTIEEDNDYSVRYIYYLLLLSQQEIYKAQTGGAQPHIHAKDLAPLIFTFPPLEEQTAIAEILSDMDAEIEMLAAKLSKARQVKQGMMPELLTGRIRLV